MEIKFHKNDRLERSLPIKDKTIIQRYLPARIPTSLCMYRKALKA